MTWCRRRWSPLGARLCMGWLWNPPKWGPSTRSVTPTWQMCLWWSAGPSTLGLPSWCILSGDFTVDLGQAHACYPEWRNKNLYLISRTFICGLQIEFEIFFSPLLSIWDWVLWIKNENLLSNPLFRIGMVAVVSTQDPWWGQGAVVTGGIMFFFSSIPRAREVGEMGGCKRWCGGR